MDVLCSSRGRRPSRRKNAPGKGARAGDRFTKHEAPRDDAEQERASRGNPRYACGRNIEAFEAVEALLGKHLDRKRDVWSPAVAGAEDIADALSWCSGCPILLRCYQQMKEYGYTGIAGGTILHHGEPVPHEPQQLNLFRG
ncbi:hypothetical protein NJBCHELONAE_43320 [Mycobacteroides chelonae]|uniref:hypothetical protein n=1 Tax=Mycobacteroides chelonae TaxID=1774 RepID=UPI0021DC59BF|nr:hypothetical protein [Mycobacteroides chelonae]GLE59021.1 hypothetical protein NJBCHELONAE_43320 [Mycobacteroides chelonae]